MTTVVKNPKVDAYLSRLDAWREECALLRKICLNTGMVEELKWGVPCYASQNSNVVLIHCFKDYCALLFMKGALLKDEKGILIQQTENVQSARQIRFTSAQDITGMEAILKAYIGEAIAVEKAGLKVERKKVSDHAIPEEFQHSLDNTPGLKSAFEALTPGRQRAYILHFSGAKQPQTRTARVQKHIPRILDGKGLDD